MKKLIIWILQNITDCDGMCNLCYIDYCKLKLNIMKSTMTIKEKSFSAFFGQYLVFDDSTHQMQANSMSNERRQYTPNILTNKVFYLRKDCGLKNNETIRFIHKDHTFSSYSPVLCTHTYRAQEYDDITIKLSLVETITEPYAE